MAILCRKCNYEISEDEINIFFWGAIASFIYTTMEFINNISSIFRKKIEDSPKIKQEKKLCAIANQQKIICPECFQYNGWIRITDQSDKTDENQKIK